MIDVAATKSDTRAVWSASRSVQRWRADLLEMMGLTPDEVANRVAALFAFCERQEIIPDEMLEECQRGEDKLARREQYLRLAAKSPENLIVQSFLVHNGVNIFGDLICMPSTSEQLIAEQGAKWVRGNDPS